MASHTAQEPTGRRKVAKAWENSTVSKCGTWRTFQEIPCLAQHKGGSFYIRKRICGKVCVRSLGTNVFSTARERLPHKAQEILTELGKPISPTPQASPNPPATPDTAASAKPVTVGDGIAKHRARLAAGPCKKKSKMFHATCEKRLLSVWPKLPSISINELKEEACWAWAAEERGEVSTNYFNNMAAYLRHSIAAAIGLHKTATGVELLNPARPGGKRRHRTLRGGWAALGSVPGARDKFTRRRERGWGGGVANGWGRQSR